MKINKKQVDMITSLPDEALRRVIQTIAASSGFDLSGINVSSAELEKLRRVLREMDDADLVRATEILKNSKNRQ